MTTRHKFTREQIKRAPFLARFEEARKEVEKLRKLYPHVMCWAVAAFPKLSKEPRA